VLYKYILRSKLLISLSWWILQHPHRSYGTDRITYLLRSIIGNVPSLRCAVAAIYFPHQQTGPCFLNNEGRKINMASRMSHTAWGWIEFFISFLLKWERIYIMWWGAKHAFSGRLKLIIVTNQNRHTLPSYDSLSNMDENASGSAQGLSKEDFLNNSYMRLALELVNK